MALAMEQQNPGAPVGGPPQQPAELDTLTRLRRWTTAALEQFLLMMWEEMLQVRLADVLHTVS